ncbi:hypothetical protein D9M72_602750 [compost metagenome]
MTPISAPSHLGLAAMVCSVSAAIRISSAYTTALFWKAISATAGGRVKTTWKYGTGSRSAIRAATHCLRAAPWHFGQWRLRQEL